MLFSTGIAQSADSTADAERRAKLNDITSRVRAGDYSALEEVSTVPTKFAVPYLMFWMQHSKSGNPQFDAAVQAIRNVPGYADWFRQEIEKSLALGVIPVNDYPILGAIGTLEMAAAVAPYLFDGRLFETEHENRPESPCGFAMMALTTMKLTDAPKEILPMSARLIAWQKWAIEKGFVPKEWSSKVGAPKWLIEMDPAWGTPTPTPSATATPQPAQSAIPSSQSAAANEAQQAAATSAMPESSPVVEKQKQWPKWAAAIIAIVGIPATIIYRKRQK